MRNVLYKMSLFKSIFRRAERKHFLGYEKNEAANLSILQKLIILIVRNNQLNPLIHIVVKKNIKILPRCK